MMIEIAAPWRDNEVISTPDHLATFAECCIGLPSTLYTHPDKGMSPLEGFDCSGFVSWVLEQVQHRDPHIRTSAQYAESFGVLVHTPKRGDLVILSRNGTKPTHIGIMVNDTDFVHAPGRDGTKVSQTSLKEYMSLIDFTRSRRYGEPIIYTSPLVCIKRLSNRTGEYKGSVWRKPIQ